MAIIASVLARIKSEPLELLGGAEKVNECFAATGHLWRKCALNPANTIALFMLQILNGNTSITHLRFLSSIPCPQASYCEARGKLPVAGVAAVVEQLSCDNARRSDPASLWLGRRVLMTNATTAATPDTPQLQAVWPRPSAQKAGCGFPVVKTLALAGVTDTRTRASSDTRLNRESAASRPVSPAREKTADEGIRSNEQTPLRVP